MLLGHISSKSSVKGYFHQFWSNCYWLFITKHYQTMYLIVIYVSVATWLQPQNTFTCKVCSAINVQGFPWILQETHIHKNRLWRPDGPEHPPGIQNPQNWPLALGALDLLSLSHTHDHLWRFLMDRVCHGTRACIVTLSNARRGCKFYPLSYIHFASPLFELIYLFILVLTVMIMMQ